MTRRLPTWSCALLAGLFLVALAPRTAGAIALNEAGTINLTMRAYASRPIAQPMGAAMAAVHTMVFSHHPVSAGLRKRSPGLTSSS